MQNATTIGKVYITGAGPGDPQLLTLRARTVIELADVILYDNLVNQEILDWSRPDAIKISVGKLPYCSVITQETIHQWMLDHALEGRQVVRLKGGDPLIFGRGAEEAAFLQENGVSFEIIPGVTSSLAAAAYAGIPLTHRENAQMVLLATGHTKRGTNKGLDFDWDQLAAFKGTIVFYMGVKHLEQIAESLVKAGKADGTPAAVVENGSLPHQRVITGNLSDIAALSKAAAVTTPALLLVGEVVKYHQQLNWFAAVQSIHQQAIA
ncbi:uroporphyrinogen-III C-methyltransferase [Flavihumibacter petaseus]|uniref:uroporphyrinogen-III C-methyltransferase n=1 Tax=Flavihumibacter petaseus NBRC 106054 TaxID=1220578 RepID=A0A0E9N1I5_9BACT|nr:uroporphyrinogen-III C-methyltransferase [Flavihumibacter petaseus]GAO43877.1 uroporphyrinogen-III C-methyltransferase [Flavihumibacter petaseus NBRC 106054]